MINFNKWLIEKKERASERERENYLFNENLYKELIPKKLYAANFIMEINQNKILA